PRAPAPGLRGDAGALAAELRKLIGDHLRLASLETRQAARTVTSMLVMAVALGLLLASGWLALVGASVLMLIDHGFDAVGAMALGAALNLLGALILYLWIRWQSRSLGWPVTLSLLGSGSVQPSPTAAP
ncbi:MAG: phage holin family protein, partial [Pseudomonadales bacterium]